jgi:hypothetical protein
MQKEYSYALRTIYNNLDLTVGKGFIKEMRDKHNLSAKLYEYIVADAKTWYEKESARKKGLFEKIEELRKKIKEEKRNNRPKINKKIQRLENSANRDICFGSRKLAQELSKNPDGQDLRKKWREKREYFMLFQGETGSNGNRFFGFSGLKDGNIIFKPSKTNRFNINFKAHSKTMMRKLYALELLALDKNMPLSVKLSKNEIQITYDEQMLHDTKFDAKKIYKKIAHIKDKEKRKNILRKEHIKHEKRLFKGKNKNRYCATDPNPDGIGVVIMDRLSNDPKGEFKVLHKEFIDFSGLSKKLKLSSTDEKQKKQNNKRRYELSIAVKYIFELMKHWKVSHFVSEELNIKERNVGNKNANRKINNVWNRTLLTDLFEKYVNIDGLKWIQINPAYSSFIGNILYNEYDPIAAAIEIGRRGIVKYIKNSSLYPEFDKTWIINGLEKRNKISKKMYDKLHDCETWNGLYGLCSTAKKSVRRKLSEFDNFSGSFLKNEKSKVKILVFT